MGVRLATFDYSTPYFYMVTIKRNEGLSAFSKIVAPGKCELNAITRSFVRCIRNFHAGCKAIAPIECFSIMPDHIHMMIRIVENEAHLRLETIVEQIMSALECRYQEVTGKRTEVFSARWHDWIIMQNGQLKAFTQYIRENPYRHWLRSCHRENFRCVGEIEFLGRKWYGYGNAAILDLPVIEPFRCSRKWPNGGDEWRAAVSKAERIGPGGAGIGTFMSPCEKACGNAIAKAGGRWIVLSPEGFGPRWHPGRKLERYCAEGRMLFLSLYPEMARQPTRQELYLRCHEMGDIVTEGLANATRNGATLSSSANRSFASDSQSPRRSSFEYRNTS